MMKTLRELPIGTRVPDNLSPTLYSRIAEHGDLCLLVNPAGGTRRVPYWRLEIMLYGV